MKSAIDIYIIRIILFLIIFLVVSACKSTLSVKGADGEFTDAGNGSFSFLSSEEKEHKIAVIEFSGEDGSTSYNTAVTDEVIRRVSREKNTKLIERSRLDAVLKEQSLQESGMISPEDSVKIGQVLPVDIIVSGKYKKDKGDLKIKGRFTKTDTAQIIKTFKFKIPIELPVTASTSNIKAAPGCERIQAPLIEAMKDLRTAALLEHAAKKAVKIPYKGKCGYIHESLMNVFKKSRYYPALYHDFLFETLEDSDPSRESEKIRTIFRYFAHDKETTKAEWNTVKRILLIRWRKFYLHYFLHPEYSNKKTAYGRIDEIMELAEKNEIGRPYAIHRDKIAYDLSAGFSCKNEDEVEANIYIFSNYKPHLSDYKDTGKKSAGALTSCFTQTTDRNHQKETLNLIIEYYKNEEKNSRTGRKFWSLIDRIQDIINDSKKSIVRVNPVQPNASHLQIINKELQDWVCYTYDEFKDQYIGKDIKSYVLKNKISCSSADVQSILKDLDSNHKRTQEIALETLAASGTAAKPAESKAIQCMKLPGSSGSNARMRFHCAQILGNIKTTKPAGINALIKAFDDLGYRVTDTAMDSVVNIGKPAIPALIRNLKNNKSARVRSNCAIVLGRIGKDARSAIPALRISAKNDSSSYVRDQAKGALTRLTR